MIYNSTNNQLSHQAPTMSSSIKTSPRARHKVLQQQQQSNKSSTTNKSTSGHHRQHNHHHHHHHQQKEQSDNRCRGRCRVQWSEQHVKEGLVLVQESQLARVVKTGPITEHYEIDPKPFASGQWARVYKCRSRSTGIVYAAKFSSRNRFNADCSAELRHEIALLSLCSQSPRVVRLHDVYETPKEIIMIMEYAPGGDLQTLIDGDLVPLEGDVVNFVRQLVEGLAYLHERNIAHLDIKPQNLVMMGNFPDCNVKLCDFEISRVVLEGTEVREILGTPDYVAPEILHYEPITLAADMWSLGVTTYVLLTGFSPFGGETDQETFKNIILGQVDFPEELFEDVSAQAKDFVAKLLVLDPSARMSAKQCLRHDWLRTAPTQASSHLRKYLSKSREVLLERVVSRENLRRAALLSQTANGLHQQQQQQQQQQQHYQTGGEQQWIGLSQSEMCLNRALNGSNGSLSLAGSGSEDYEPGAHDTSSSRTSLADSVSSSKSSLAMSQSCLLNKEQTEGLLHQAQDRRSLRASMAQGLNRIGLLSKIRSLNQVQSRSQACLPLLSGLIEDEDRCRGKRHIAGHPLNGCQFDGSREKLYGLKSLSKSQGMLDIYRSLESLQRHKRDLSKHKERSKTEDALPFFRHLGHGSSSGSLGSASSTRSATVAREFADESTFDLASNEPNYQLAQRQKSVEVETEAIEPTKILTTTTMTTTATSECQNDRNMKHQINDQGGTNCKTEMPCNNGIESTRDTKSLTTASVPGGGGGGGAAGSDTRSTGPSSLTVSEANLDSLQSLESDTLTDDSEETGASRSLSNKQSSAGSECHYGRETDSENDEPKFTVAQLVSAFNKHQEVASRTSLEAIISEKRVPSDDSAAHFPIGPKALRLFIPDIDISERKPLVRRKTSYKPRKNWEELRKQNEKDEGLPKKDFFNDSGNEDDVELNPNDEEELASNASHQLEEPQHDTRIDEKYKQCVESAKKNEQAARVTTTTASIATAATTTRNSPIRTETPPTPTSLSPSSVDSGVNLRDILQKLDAEEGKDVGSCCPLEKTRDRISSPTKPTVNNNNNNNNNHHQDKNKINNNKNNTTGSSNNLASRISIFSSDKRPSKSPTRPESKTRLAVKEKLCTGSYVRAMERFSSKSNVDNKQQQPRSRRTSATQIGDL